MKILSTVIYTDKLPAVREFWTNHFQLTIYAHEPHSFTVFLYGESAVEYVDAAWAGVSPTQGALIRYLLPHVPLEQARLKALGCTVSDLKSEHWNEYTGENVYYFTLQDPSGTQYQIYQEHYGQARQLMMTGDGTDTRKVHKKDE